MSASSPTTIDHFIHQLNVMNRDKKFLDKIFEQYMMTPAKCMIYHDIFSPSPSGAFVEHYDWENKQVVIQQMMTPGDL